MSSLLVHRDGSDERIDPALQRLIDEPFALTVEVPSLAERREDIVPMVEAWVRAKLGDTRWWSQTRGARQGRSIKPVRLSERLSEQLRVRECPLGVASLERVVDRIVHRVVERDWSDRAEISVDLDLVAVPEQATKLADAYTGPPVPSAVLERLDQVRVERPPLVVLRGPRGAGKRALIEAAAEAMDDFVPLTPERELDRAARAPSSEQIFSCGASLCRDDQHRLNGVAWPDAERLDSAQQRHLADLLGVNGTALISLNLTDDGAPPRAGFPRWPTTSSARW